MQEFECKEGCGEKVRYQPQATPGGLGASFETLSRGAPDDPVFVYLTCPNGHVHGYVVQPRGLG
jgi:hypothetical protein